MNDNDRLRHDFKGHLTIILGFSELLIAQSPADDPRRRDLMEIQQAARDALALLARVFPPSDAMHG
ncbi:MAG: hypothetical protein ABUL71_00825 [Gemmatimonadota bacterium]